MNITRNTLSKTLLTANRKWRTALDGACERIRNARSADAKLAPRAQSSNAEILDAALRVREEFKGVGEGNAQMVQALVDFRNRRRRMSCERSLGGTTGLSSAPRP